MFFILGEEVHLVDDRAMIVIGRRGNVLIGGGGGGAVEIDWELDGFYR